MTNDERISYLIRHDAEFFNYFGDCLPLLDDAQEASGLESGSQEWHAQMAIWSDELLAEWDAPTGNGFTPSPAA